MRVQRGWEGVCTDSIYTNSTQSIGIVKTRALTDRDYLAKNYLEIRLLNATAVTIAVDAFVADWWSDGDYRYLEVLPCAHACS